MAFAIVLWVAFLLSKADAIPTKIENRIIEGTESVKNSHPFMVSVQYTEYLFHFCGGSLITSRTVLTAAHCVWYPKKNITHTANEVMVILGEHHMYRKEGTELRRDVERIIVHEGYGKHTSPFDSDLALLILNEDVPFTDAIQPICLYANTDYGFIPPTVAGWGQTLEDTTSTNLMEVQVPIVPDERCKIYGKNWHAKNMICAGYPDLPVNHKDICQGDSGGPLFIPVQGKKVEIGLVSFNSALGCSRKGYPSVYTKLSEFTDWIVSNAKGNVCIIQ